MAGERPLAGRRATAALMLAILFSGAPLYAQTPAVALAPSSVAVPSAPAPSAPATDIRDIRGPEPIASAWIWALVGAAGALFATGAYLAWRRSRRHRRPAVRSPQQLALEQLEATRVLMHAQRVRAFSIAVSDIVRLYIEQRFQVLAAHRTTEEFLYDLLDPSDALLAANRAPLADFLHHCDMAKFGGWTLSQQEMDSMHQSARAFVLLTGQPSPGRRTRGPTPQPAQKKDGYDSVPAA
jgi:hypothetical protein